MIIETRQEARQAQLEADGLAGYYRDAAAFRTETHPAEVIPASRPLLGAIRCKQEFVRRHDSTNGLLPAGGIYTIRDCFVSKAGTLMDADRKVLWADDLASDYWVWFLGKMIGREVVNPNPIKVSDICAFIAGKTEARAIDEPGPVVVVTKPGVGVYGHWILDTLPMLWHLHDAAERGLAPPMASMKYLLSQNTPRWAQGMIALLFGITPDRLILFDDSTEVVHLRHAIIPGILRVSPLISSEMNRFVEFVLARTRSARPTPDVIHPKRVFISRADFSSDKNRLLQNAPEVLAAAQAAGLEPVMPERLPWPEQVAMFAGAEIVAGEYGSGMHNTMFADARCVPIVFTTKKMNWSQTALSTLRGQQMIYVQPLQQEWQGVHGLVYTIDPDSVGEAVALANAAF